MNGLDKPPMYKAVNTEQSITAANDPLPPGASKYGNSNSFAKQNSEPLSKQFGYQQTSFDNREAVAGSEARNREPVGKMLGHLGQEASTYPKPNHESENKDRPTSSYSQSMQMYARNLNTDSYQLPERNNENPQMNYKYSASSATATSLTGYGARPSSAGYQHDSGRKSFTPSHHGNGGQGQVQGQGQEEDIRSKLARYKQEREDFEKVRQQFREKNKEIERKHSGTREKADSFVP